MKINRMILIALSFLIWSCEDDKQNLENQHINTNEQSNGKAVNFMTAVSAESELMFNGAIDRAGGVNKFDHSRKPATVETQAIVRSQSDMLYSHGVFDASEGLEITVPEATTAYQSVHLFDSNHGQLGVVYSGESKKIAPEDIGTDEKHIYVLMRTSTDKGLDIANKAQDDVRIIAKANTPYVGPGYNQDQLKEAKRILAGTASIVKAKTASSKELIPNTTMLKDASDIDKYNFICSNLLGWGLMPNDQAYYPQLVIEDANCATVNFPKPPVQYEKSGYWSLTAYGKDGYLHSNNSVISAYTAKANSDGSFTVYVGNSEDCKTHKNQIDMPEGGASLTLRMYRPISVEEAKKFEKLFKELNSK